MNEVAVNLGHGVVLDPDGWAARLGRALRDARCARDASVRALARESGGRFTARDLRRFERGLRPVGDRLSPLLADLYEVELADIAPPDTALEVDLGARVVRAGGATRPFDGDADLVHGALSAYLELVWAMRGGRRTHVSLRRGDVALLGDALALDEERVVEQLAELMQVSRDDARRMLVLLRSRPLVVPLAITALVGVTAGLALVTRNGEHGRADLRVTRGPDAPLVVASAPSAAASRLPTASSLARTLLLSTQPSAVGAAGASGGLEPSLDPGAGSSPGTGGGGPQAGSAGGLEPSDRTAVDGPVGSADDADSGASADPDTPTGAPDAGDASAPEGLPAGDERADGPGAADSTSPGAPSADPGLVAAVSSPDGSGVDVVGSEELGDPAIDVGLDLLDAAPGDGTSSVEDSLTGDSSTGDTPVGDTPVAEAPAGDPLAGDPSPGDDPTDESSAGIPSAGDPSTGDPVSAGDSSEDASVADPSVEDSTSTGGLATGDPSEGSAPSADAPADDSSSTPPAGDPGTGDPSSTDSPAGAPTGDIPSSTGDSETPTGGASDGGSAGGTSTGGTSTDGSSTGGTSGGTSTGGTSTGGTSGGGKTNNGKSEYAPGQGGDGWGAGTSKK